MSTSYLVILAMKFFGLLILVNQVSSADYGTLLSRLYKRASASDRPLIVLIDSNFLQSDRQTYNRPSKVLDAIGYKGAPYRGSLLDNFMEKQRKPRNRNVLRPQKIYDLEKKLHQALLPTHKRVVSREKEILRSPIIKNLLRISNNLKCQAKDECEDQCSNKYSGSKANSCMNTCESKFDCNEEPESDCDECDANSCGQDDCNKAMSTKGYTSTDPPNPCPEC